MLLLKSSWYNLGHPHRMVFRPLSPLLGLPKSKGVGDLEKDIHAVVYKKKWFFRLFQTTRNFFLQARLTNTAEGFRSRSIGEDGDILQRMYALGFINGKSSSY